MEERLAQALDQVGALHAPPQQEALVNTSDPRRPPQIQQLQHELSKKDELLRLVASASEDSEGDSSCSTPLCRSHIPPASPSLSQLEALQRKLQELEEENTELRSEVRLRGPRLSQASRL